MFWIHRIYWDGHFLFLLLVDFRFLQKQKLGNCTTNDANAFFIYIYENSYIRMLKISRTKHKTRGKQKKTRILCNLNSSHYISMETRG